MGMSITQLAIAGPAALVMWILARDFFAGLSEERLWSDPALDKQLVDTDMPGSRRLDLVAESSSCREPEGSLDFGCLTLAECDIEEAVARPRKSGRLSDQWWPRRSDLSPLYRLEA